MNRRGLTKVLLGSATLLVALNIWTGAPLLALWVGSRAAGQGGLSMGAVFVVIVVLATSVILLTMALTWLNARYDEATGRPQPTRRVAPWLRSMRGERPDITRSEQGVNGIERLMILVVASCIVAFEIWFFFFAGSSIGPA
jgi:hypothetical protein